MELVGSGHGHHSDLPPGPLSKLGAVVVTDYVVFPHCVNTQQLSAGASWRYGGIARSRIFHAVQQNHVFSTAPPRHGEQVPTHARVGGGLIDREIDRARVQGDQEVEAAPVE